MNRKLIFMLTLCLWYAGMMTAQTAMQVRGSVVDETGEPVIGASIRLKHAPDKGTITDADGFFTLPAPSPSVLVVSYMGMKTQEVEARPELRIVMRTDAELLDEVIVVAYGTAKKSSFTGSASVVKSEQLEKISGSGFVEALQGMSAGVNITNNEGNRCS